MVGKNILKRIDWLTIFIYVALVAIGLVNIYSSSFSDDTTSLFDFGTLPGKQLFFFGVSVAVIIVILALETHFYERFSGVIYIGALLLLIGLFLFGKTIAGATSWYSFGFF